MPGALTICEVAILRYQALPEMTIGYLWEEIQDTGVVDLTPTWFAYYQNQWLPYDELVQIYQTGKGLKNGFQTNRSNFSGRFPLFRYFLVFDLSTITK